MITRCTIIILTGRRTYKGKDVDDKVILMLLKGWASKVKASITRFSFIMPATGEADEGPVRALIVR